jgi:hypothetical protein
MPQFDTFSFFSQLFWVFLGFLFLYLLICFYLLPALAATLKIRKRKLAQSTALTQQTDLVTNNSFLSTTKVILDNFNTKLGLMNTQNNSTNNTSNLNKSLSATALVFESFREFNLTAYTQAQITALLYV